jgi:hypothetical protein
MMFLVGDLLALETGFSYGFKIMPDVIEGLDGTGVGISFTLPPLL